MDNLIYFSSDKIQSPYSEIKRFIDFVKQLSELNEDIRFDENYWKGEVNFVKTGISSKDRLPENLLHHSILEFAKAYVKYQRINSKLKTQDTILSIRAIEQICLDRYGEVDLTKLVTADFDLAAENAKVNYKASSAYHVGRQLKILLDFIRKLKIVALPEWKNPIKKPVDKSIVLDEESEEHRESKLPDEDAIFALADIFSRKDSELSNRDIFVTSAVSLLLSAPERASELFFLKHNCMHEEESQTLSKSTLGLVADGSNIEKVLGIRWYAQKNYGYDIKYIPNVMIPTVKRAIERLIKLSEKPRYLAYLLETSDKFPRHELCPKVSDNQLLKRTEVLMAMGFDVSLYDDRQANESGKNFLMARDIPIRDYAVCLNDLNIILRNRLPQGFPYVTFQTGNGVRVKWSEALFACFVHQFHKKFSPIMTELWMPHIDTLNEDLAPTRKKKKGKDELVNVKSIFQRWGYGDYSMSTHQFRHLLNTIANTNGMDSLLLAKWSGRADIKQNRVYDHTTVDDRNYGLIEMQKNEVGSVDADSTFTFQIATPRTLQELNTKTTLSMHTTEFGLCTHSYIDEPCLKYRNCLNCTEHVCIKGELEKKKRLQDRLKKEKILWVKDKESVSKNVTGATVWLEMRELTIKRCEQMIALLEDPNIPDGTPLSLPPSEDVTHLDLAYQKAGHKRIPVIENTQRIINKSVQPLLDSNLTESWI
ncbi:integrase [Acinetobacter pittii]|uniref:Integrase n=1 Tax=Acinetobacter pittii TaxID=48296 RepID=A0A8I1HC87_ACIPI|nr:integrase [Acinetobacter pittii]MBF9202787.1 integrase [Acinetobacter pittii]MBK1445865.1 integrase [Acinetobacter pittii]MBW8293248.1 integrase [Acinetobacter pittii]MCJ9043430.1 integrase [Acinetobacter pittii]MDX8220454.1 integrase [Acinetobacter pittii]